MTHVMYIVRKRRDAHRLSETIGTSSNTGSTVRIQ